MIRFALFATAAGLTLASLSASAQEARPMALPADGTLLEVSAEGTSTRTPDLAIIQAGVVTQNATAGEAMRQNSARMATVLAALRRAGVAERDVQTSNIALNPQYRYADKEPPVITGYQASNQVTVRFRDIGKSGAILDALVREGANNISGPNLTIDKPEAALDEARTAAVASARARADLYAKAAGLRVDRILSISEGGAMPPPPMPMMARAERFSADAATPVVAGEQELRVSLSVRFLLK
ncbi:SIMPL domain-containing protein [Sphingomonas psychrotolerans]|uniref:SIMPL domain-containing protein n=1 Tax=Sphingomonas psychrotolerans TaxID=1327635 RepID=A0ABU3N4H9_9SPHN|nr:SIMPL domain-containing protein [Sphingomonas psychrotolerans]MDT8759161.1 SIMPL domain-containing protein [Sphingomonas psychrotolerans]